MQTFFCTLKCQSKSTLPKHQHMVIQKQQTDLIENDKQDNPIEKTKNVVLMTYQNVRDKDASAILQKQRLIVNKLDTMRKFVQYDINEEDDAEETLKYLDDLENAVSKLTYPSKMMKKGKIPMKSKKKPSQKPTTEQMEQENDEAPVQDPQMQEPLVQEPPIQEPLVQEPPVEEPPKLSEAKINPEILNRFNKPGPKKKKLEYVNVDLLTSAALYKLKKKDVNHATWGSLAAIRWNDVRKIAKGGSWPDEDIKNLKELHALAIKVWTCKKCNTIKLDELHQCPSKSQLLRVVMGRALKVRARAGL